MIFRENGVTYYKGDEDSPHLKWHLRFLEQAKFVSTWSKDPSTKTGAVIVRPDRTVASQGYNGFPKGVRDDPELYADREIKYSRIIHCEMNAILHCHENLTGYTLYTYSFLSCERCAPHVIETGITTCVAPILPKHLEERWGESTRKTIALYREKKIEVILLDFK
jgi:dCMP deaminase